MRTFTTTVTAAAAAALLLTGCSGSMSGGHGMASPSTSTTGAATLRTGLNTLFAEHVVLASAATGAALDGRDAEFKAAAGALDANSVAIGQAIGSVYGKDAEAAFLPLWRRHIGFAVDYTTGRGRRRPRQAGQGGERSGRLQSGLRRVPRLGQSEPAQERGGRPGEAPRGHAQGRHRRPGRQGPRARVRGDADRERAHGDDRRSAGGRHRQAVPRPLPRRVDVGVRRPAHHAERGAAGARLPGRRATGAALGGRDAEFKARGGRARRQLGGDRPGDRLRVRQGRRGARSCRCGGATSASSWTTRWPWPAATPASRRWP